MCGVCGKEPCECVAVSPSRMTSVKAIGSLGPNATATLKFTPKPMASVPAKPALRVVQVGAARTLTQPTLNPMRMGATRRMGTHKLSGADIAEVHDEASRAHRTLAAVMMPMITDVNASQAQRNFLAEALPVLHGCAATARAMANKNDHIDDAGLDVVERAAMLAARAREIS